jgi:ribonucleoside-diphosphate reductase beta chain
MSVFDTQKAFKPFMYNWAVKFKEAISDTPWTIKKFTFDSDYHEYQTLLTRPEREGARRGMLAISQVEVKVKDYWGDLGKRFPRPEFSQVGWTFAENEVRHADSYSALLDLLGLAQDFEWVMDTPAIGGRVDYLSKHLAVGTARHEHTLSLVLFSILVENVSLFAQFALLRSIRKHRNMLKGVSNVVDATMQEEQVHGLFGIRLVNQVRAENPDWFDAAFYERVYDVCRKAEAAESAIIDWMLEAGDLPYLTRADLKAFIRNRINESLGLIGGRPLFAVDPAALANTEWLSVELLARTSYDFFDSHVTNYSQAGKAITADSIF